MAAGVEVAAARGIDRARDVAGQDHALAPLDVRVRDRHGREQRLAVRMQRRGEQRALVGQLDDPPEIHHRDPVADVLDDRDVVGDEQVRELVLLLEVHQQVQHLSLDRDVEGGDGLVPDDEARAERQRPRDADALALPPGELVGELVHALGAKPHALEQRGDPLPLLLAGRDLVHGEWLADDASNRHARIQRRVRVLEDDLHLAAQRPHPRPVVVRDVLAAQLDGSGGRLDQLQRGLAGRRLSASALAHEPQRLAPADGEGYAVDGVHLPHGAREHPLAKPRLRRGETHGGSGHPRQGPELSRAAPEARWPANAGLLLLEAPCRLHAELLPGGGRQGGRRSLR